jgi:hypothetical protein
MPVSEAKCKRKIKKNKTEINGKFNYMNSADESK